MGDTPSEGAFWTRIAQKGLDGTDGGDGADGSEVELQKGTTHLQWRYVGGSTWTNLVALDDLKGAAGSNGVNGRGYNLTFTSLSIDVSIEGKTLILGSMAQPSSSPNMVAALATAYSTGNRVRLSANSSTWIEGQMAIISPSGMYGWGLTVTKISGSGTYSTWNVSIAGEPGLDGVGGGVTSYTQLTDKPTLGTAAATDATAYATAAQGAKADSALQSGAAISTISGLQTALGGKLGLSESSYIIAKPGDDLAAKYAEAKALDPNGAAKSNANRASLIILPGRYTLSAELLIDAEFVDVLGLGSQMHRAAVLMSDVGGGSYSPNVPNVSANNVRILGIGSSGRFKITGDKPLQVFENCTSELEGFYPTASGTFTGCRGGAFSFGGSIGSASGTFTNCSAGSASFGNVASGRFTNCTAASNYTICSGTFTNCSGGEASFGTYAAASGVFIGCTGGRYSFGGRPSGTSNATGVFINCRLTAETFRPLTAPATGKALMVNCIDGNGDIIEGQAPL